MKFFWLILHNCVAHPLLLLTALQSTKVTCAVNKFHDYTGARAYCQSGFQLDASLKLSVTKITAVAQGAVVETTTRDPKNSITCCEKHRQAYQRLIDDKDPKRPIFGTYDDCFTDPPRKESLQFK